MASARETAGGHVVNFSTVSSPVPYAIRALALSHARAWPTAIWTGSATALAAGLALSPAEWGALIGLTAVCGAAVRSIAAQLVQTWLSTQTRDAGWRRTFPEPRSDFDTATLHALSTLA